MSVTMFELKDGTAKFTDGTTLEFPKGLTYRVAPNTGMKIVVEVFAEDGIKLAAVLVGATRRAVESTVMMVEGALWSRKVLRK